VRISFVWNLDLSLHPSRPISKSFVYLKTSGVFFLACYTLFFYFFYCNTTYSIFGDDSPRIETERKRERKRKCEKKREREREKEREGMKEKERKSECISMREREKRKEKVSARGEKKDDNRRARGDAKESGSY